MSKTTFEDMFGTLKGKHCETCKEPIYQEKDGVVFPRSCECRRKDIEKYDKGLELEEKRQKQEIVMSLYSTSNIGERFQHRTFSVFEQEKQPVAFEICRRYCEKFSELKAKGEGLVLMGTVGTGKTHLAGAIANELIKKQFKTVIFTTIAQIMDSIKAEFDNKKEKKTQHIYTCELLILDDIGKEKASDYMKEKLFEIINTRYERLLPIIITTNLDMKGFRAFLGEALFSRIVEQSHFINIKGEDYRLRNLNNRSIKGNSELRVIKTKDK